MEEKISGLERKKAEIQEECKRAECELIDVEDEKIKEWSRKVASRGETTDEGGEHVKDGEVAEEIAKLQRIRRLCEQISHSIQDKKQAIQNENTLFGDFKAQSDDILSQLNEMVDGCAKILLLPFSLESIKTAQKKVESFESQLANSLNPKLAQVRNLAQILASGSSENEKLEVVQSQISALEICLQTLQNSLSQKSHDLQNFEKSWLEIEEYLNKLNNPISNAQNLLGEIQQSSELGGLKSYSDLKALATRMKGGYQTLIQQRIHLDYAQARMKRLITEAETLGFLPSEECTKLQNATPLVSECRSTFDKVENSIKKLIEKLDILLANWQKFDHDADEIEQIFLKNYSNIFSELLENRNPENKALIQQKLSRYKEDLQIYEARFSQVKLLRAKLSELNESQPVQGVEERSLQLEKQFSAVSSQAAELSTLFGESDKERALVGEELAGLLKWVQERKAEVDERYERSASAYNLSDQDLFSEFEFLKGLIENLEAKTPEIEQISSKIDMLVNENQNTMDSTLFALRKVCN